MSEASPSTSTETTQESAKRRLSPKWLIVGGGAALGLLLVVAAAWALWPSVPVPAQGTNAKRAAHAASAAQAAASSPAVTAVSASAPAPAGGGHEAAAITHAAPASATSTGEAHAQAAPTPRDAPGDFAPDATAPAEAPSPPLAHAPPRPEAPLARLQRRLGQILGPQSQLEATKDGELKVLMRSPGLTRVAHAPPPVVPAKATVHDAPTVAWGYEGRGGPQAWGRLKPEYRLCASGNRQSPIDIRDGVALDLEPLQFDYRAGDFGIVDTGRTVQVNVAPGQWLEAGGRRFELQQLQFHRPSEERINGRRFEMGVHLVHRDAEGRIAIVAVLLERGEAQPLLHTLWRHLPLDKGDEVVVRAPIDVSRLLPADRRYFTYMGSLTAPPCTEGVLWLVLQQPVPVSAEQIDVFARLYPMNARPVQHAAGRLIKQSQ